MPGIAENGQNLVQRGVARHRDDVGARDHDVADPALAQAENVGQHRPLLGAEIGELSVLLILRQRFGDVLADRAAAAQAEPVEKLAEPMAKAAPGLIVRGGSTVVAHDALEKTGVSASGSESA